MPKTSKTTQSNKDAENKPKTTNKDKRVHVAKGKARVAPKTAPTSPPPFMPNGLLTLTTDFGAQDAYVASMKGVILSLCPALRLEDLSHEIPPQSILAGALFLADATPYFPPGTVHLVVVDPGVGSSRKAIAAQVNDQRFICPDNGLLSLLFEKHPLQEVREISNPKLMRSEISQTFHGRDIFAPVAAQLAQGLPLEEVGPRLNHVEMLEISHPVAEGDMIQGEVIYIDHFGNCVTNILQDLLQDDTPYRVQFAATTIECISRNYAETEPGEAMALFGSSKRLEIAVREGDAAEEFQLEPGAAVTLFIP